jgi:hypothetical protein
MPAQVVLAHDIEDFATEAAAPERGLRGRRVYGSTRGTGRARSGRNRPSPNHEVNFPPGKPNGVSLALMTRTRRPNIRIVFAAVAETEPYTVGIGEFLPMPVHIPDLVATVLRLLPKTIGIRSMDGMRLTSSRRGARPCAGLPGTPMFDRRWTSRPPRCEEAPRAKNHLSDSPRPDRLCTNPAERQRL